MPVFSLFEEVWVGKAWCRDLMSSACCERHAWSWLVDWVSLQYLNSMMRMTGLVPRVMIIASGRELALSRSLPTVPGSELRGRIGASSSAHFDAEPRSAMTRSPPMSPFEMALRSILPV